MLFLSCVRGYFDGHQNEAADAENVMPPLVSEGDGLRLKHHGGKSSALFLITLVTLVITFTIPLSAQTTYYIAANGNDANSGLTKLLPWSHAPGMPNCASACLTKQTAGLAAADQFIFKGGDTWHFGNSGASPYTGGAWAPAWPSWTLANTCIYGAAQSLCTYFGVDATWFTGGVWTRPILTGDNPTTSTTVASCLYTVPQVSGAGSGMIQPPVAGIFDNFELTGFCTDTTAGVMIWQPSFSGLTVFFTNNYIHGWSETAAGYALTVQTCAIFGGNSGGLSVMHHNVIDGSDSNPRACAWNGAGASMFHFYDNYVGNTSQGITQHCHNIHDNIFELFYGPNRDDMAISAISRTGTTVTVTISSTVGFGTVGTTTASAYIGGVADAANFPNTSISANVTVVSSTQVSYQQAGSAVSSSGGTITSIVTHGNLLECNTDSPGNETGNPQNTPNVFYNNIVRHVASSMSGGGNPIVWLAPRVQDEYWFNNLEYDAGNGGGFWNVCWPKDASAQCAASDGSNNIYGTGLIRMFNNTLADGTQPCSQVGKTQLEAYNEHLINTPFGTGAGSNCYTSADVSNIAQTDAQAISQGYASNTGRINTEFPSTNCANEGTTPCGPISAGLATIGTGINKKVAYCNQLATYSGDPAIGTDAAAACLKGTTDACTYQLSDHTMQCPAQVAVSRPTVAAWDSGAYFLNSGVTAPTCTLTASPAVIKLGTSSTLTFTPANTPTGCSIDNGVGVVSCSGATPSVSPTTLTTYTATVTNAGGTNTCSASVTIGGIAAAANTKFGANALIQ